MVLTGVGDGVQVALFKVGDWFTPRNAAVLVRFGISQVANLTRGAGDADTHVQVELLDEVIAGVIASGVFSGASDSPCGCAGSTLFQTVRFGRCFAVGAIVD